MHPPSNEEDECCVSTPVSYVQELVYEARARATDRLQTPEEAARYC